MSSVNEGCRTADDPSNACPHRYRCYARDGYNAPRSVNGTDQDSANGIDQDGACLCHFYYGRTGGDCRTYGAAAFFNLVSLLLALTIASVLLLVITKEIYNRRKKLQTRGGINAVNVSLFLVQAASVFCIIWKGEDLAGNFSGDSAQWFFKGWSTILSTSFTIASWSTISLSWIDVATSVMSVRRTDFHETKKVVSVTTLLMVLVIGPLYYLDFNLVTGLLILVCVLVLNAAFFVGARRLTTMLSHGENRTANVSRQVRAIVRTSLLIHVVSAVYFVSIISSQVVLGTSYEDRTLAIRPQSFFVEMNAYSVVVGIAIIYRYIIGVQKKKSKPSASSKVSAASSHGAFSSTSDSSSLASTTKEASSDGASTMSWGPTSTSSNS